jgi:hypothetical protein
VGSLAEKRARRGVSFSFCVLLLPFICSIVTVHAAPLALDSIFQPFARTVGEDFLGLPISPLITRDGMRYQYTERARLETPVTGNGPVQLARAGSILSSGRDFKPLDSPSVNPDTRYFPETKHSLAYGFRLYWEQRGGVDVFGLPISEEFQERNPADGKMYDVQYFERAKFERHPEFTGTPNEIPRHAVVPVRGGRPIAGLDGPGARPRHPRQPAAGRRYRVHESAAPATARAGERPRYALGPPAGAVVRAGECARRL